MIIKPHHQISNNIRQDNVLVHVREHSKTTLTVRYKSSSKAIKIGTVKLPMRLAVLILFLRLQMRVLSELGSY